MKKVVLLLIVLISGVLYMPGAGLTQMTAMTDDEMAYLTGQNGITALPAGVFVALMNQDAVSFDGWGGPAGVFASGWDNPYRFAGIGGLSLDIPIQLDTVLTGEGADSAAMQHLISAMLGTAGLVNPLLSGFLFLESVPGAFDVSMGDVSINVSGTITLSTHP